MNRPKNKSQLCLVMLHEHCPVERCDCDCHFEWTGIKEFTDFEYECWKSRVSEKVTHVDGKIFTPWWDVVAMWLAYKYPDMHVRDQQKYVDAAWVTINKDYWSLEEAKKELASYLSK